MLRVRMSGVIPSLTQISPYTGKFLLYDQPGHLKADAPCTYKHQIPCWTNIVHSKHKHAKTDSKIKILYLYFKRTKCGYSETLLYKVVQI
jgi:hypothetical protein